MLEQRVEHSIKTNMRTEAHVRHNRTIEKPQPTEEDKKNAPPTAFIYMYVVRVYQYMKIESAAAKKKTRSGSCLINTFVTDCPVSSAHTHSVATHTNRPATKRQKNKIKYEYREAKKKTAETKINRYIVYFFLVAALNRFLGSATHIIIIIAFCSQYTIYIDRTISAATAKMERKNI